MDSAACVIVNGLFSFALHFICYLVQVSSLRAQANEHRMIKEKLQAAVSAALSGDCCADTDLLPPQLCSVTAEETGNAEAAKHASVMDLQDAISTLKVTCQLLLAELACMHSWLSLHWRESFATLEPCTSPMPFT